MNYIYNNISYNKRPLTDDIALWVVSNDFSSADERSPEFEKLTRPYKSGELAGQQDSCPVTGIKGLREYVDLLKKKFNGFRIRNSQLSGIIAVGGDVTADDVKASDYLIACGSIAVIAKKYADGSDIKLLSDGILPLVSDEELPTGSFVLIRNIRRDILKGKFEAYIVTPDNIRTVGISFGSYDENKLKAVLE